MPLETTTIADRTLTRLGLGCWAFGGQDWGGQDDDDSLTSIGAALDGGITHFDTATAYGDGRSEQVLGRALNDNGEVHIASKARVTPTADAMVECVEASRQRLGVECIDLYYIHWPQSGVDPRPAMEGLERCRAGGVIGGIGVSNMSCEQMDQLREAGTIDAHQFCYNLFWRFPEDDLIPYCQEHGIAGVTYSSIAQGILTGKFGKDPKLEVGDLRGDIVLFDEKVYPHLYKAVESLKPLAKEADRKLVELAIRWVLTQPGADVVLVGARRPEQVESNLRAAEGELDQQILDAMTEISDEAVRHVPDAGNLWDHHP